MSGPAIEVHNLVVRYRKTVAVGGISFEAQPGQIVALLGPNGAGKTSTIEVLEGYRRPTVGKVRVIGLDPVRDHRALTRRIGVMLQRGGVYPTMSPRQAVRLFAHYYDESEEPDGLLFRVGLSSVATTPWRQLSGGEQQRLSLALALVGRPWVAFLDEPTAGVDPQGRMAIREVVEDLRSAGTCVLLTTHEMQEAERLADRIIILDHGRIVADGTPAELMARGGGQEIRFGAPAGLDTGALGVALAATVVEARPGEYLVHAEPRPAVIAALTAWLADRDVPLADLRAGRERLEDVFLRLTGGEASVPEPAPAQSRSPGFPSSAGSGGTVGRRRRVRASGHGPGATDPAEGAATSERAAGPEAEPQTAAGSKPAEVPAAVGTRPAVAPGTEPGTGPGTELGPTAGSKPAEVPAVTESEPGAGPGTAAAAAAGSEPAAGQGTELEPAAGPGTEPAAGSGPAAGPGTEPGPTAGSERAAGPGTEPVPAVMRSEPGAGPEAGNGTEPAAGLGTTTKRAAAGVPTDRTADRAAGGDGGT